MTREELLEEIFGRIECHYYYLDKYHDDEIMFKVYEYSISEDLLLMYELDLIDQAELDIEMERLRIEVGN